MPRDSTPTKERLLREAERLFARRGPYRVTLREITDAAGQRNVSAVNYHFGSREGLLEAILARHGDPTDAARGELRARLADGSTTRDLVAVLVVPYAAHLATPEGRDYLRIVAGLSPLFSDWRADTVGTGPHLVDILTMLEARPTELPAAVRRERVVEMIMLMTAAMSSRARQLESRRPVELDDDTFEANLTDVLVGVLEAPLLGPLPAALVAPGGAVGPVPAS
ncbi:TetR/AcrR family transcriptional regulator [Rhabdothermincola salaria]|uniref:TetR/AcrR family transcriptional regulator n=1 Tax=Rhabdothermincola salaria TaxID=2903142 RepID=UPI001E2A9075|nr:TetR/AcrR family transcriptional regulator [Rhabdothermincola salaria]